MVQQVIRNCKRYFRNKAAFVVSFISMFVMIIIYALFLLKMIADQHLTISTGGNANAIVSVWLLGGMLVMNSINATMGCLGLIIADEEDLKIKDFTISPFTPFKLTLSYVISAFIVGMIVCLVSLLVVFLFLLIASGEFLSILVYLKMLPVIMLAVLTTAAFITFTYSCIRKQSTLIVINTIAGAVMGFLVGAYVPMGQLPGFIQVLMKFIPFTYVTSLMRWAMMPGVLAPFLAPLTDAQVTDYYKMTGVYIYIGDYRVPPWLCVIIAFLTIAVFFGLTVLRNQIKKRNN